MLKKMHEFTTERLEAKGEVFVYDEVKVFKITIEVEDHVIESSGTSIPQMLHQLAEDLKKLIQKSYPYLTKFHFGPNPGD
jgi:hypothetical protein